MQALLHFRRYALLLLLPLLLGACDQELGDRVWLNAPGWGRAQLVGTTRPPDPAQVAVDDAGLLYLFIMPELEDGVHPQVRALDRQLEVAWEQTLPPLAARADSPKLLWDGERLLLFWLSGEDIFGAELSPAGDVLVAPRILAAAGDGDIDSFDVAVDSQGRASLWYGGSRRRGGLYAFAPGDLDGAPRLVDAAGIRPQILYDEAGTLHAVWAHYAQGAGGAGFFYGAYPGGMPTDDAATLVREESISFTSGLEGPVLGLTTDDASLMWNIEVRTGLDAGQATTEYVTFPPGAPETATEPQRLVAPGDYQLPYQPAAVASGRFNSGQRVNLATAPGRAAPAMLNPAKDVAEELVTAMQATVAYRLRKSASQVGLVYFSDGASESYQLISFTRTFSSDPFVTADADGYLYFTWLEPGEESGLRVYLASSAPDVSANLGNISAADVFDMTLQSLFGFFSGAALSPFFAVLWMVAPLVVLAATSFIRRESDDRISVGTAISLVLAVAVFTAVKLMTLPGYADYVPFSAWIPVLPAWLEAPLQWIVLPAITLIAVVVAWFFTFGRRNQSALYFMLAFAATDAFLTLGVYGVLIYAAF